MSVVYDSISHTEIEAAHAIETICFPQNETDDLKTLRFRQMQEPDLFLGAYLSEGNTRTLIGYICATLSPEATYTKESLSMDIPLSQSVCIHSVCIAPSYEGMGVGSGLLKEYISRIEDARSKGSPYERILLITHEELRAFYEKAGFEFVGPSPIVRGPRPWFEMRRIISASPSS